MNIDLKKTPVTCMSQVDQLDRFFVWLMKNYRTKVVEEFCVEKHLNKITSSVLTNPARARDPIEFKENQTIPRVYYEVCFSRRGPYYKEHFEAKNTLRDLHKMVIGMIRTA